MFSPLAALRTLALLYVTAGGGGAGPEGCNCQAECAQIVAHQQEEIERLRAEVHELRGGADPVERGAASARCSKRTWNVKSNADVEAFRRSGCREAKRIDLLRATVTSLAGFSNLEAVGELSISLSHALNDLTGLEKLRVVTGWLRFQGNNNLRSLSALKNLETAGQVTVASNPRLSSLAGLENLKRVTRDLSVVGNTDLHSLAGLESLTSVSRLTIGSSNIPSLAGLDNLTSVFHVILINNPQLSSLTGLEGITSMGILQIEENDKLESLAGLERLETVTGRCTFLNGGFRSLLGLQGLRSVGEINLHEYYLESLTGLDNLKQVQGDLKLSGTQIRSLDGLGALTTVGKLSLSNMFHLRSLSGLSSRLEVAWNGIFVSNVPHLRTLEGLSARRAAQLSVESGNPMQYLGAPLAKGAEVEAVRFSQASWPPCVTSQEREALLSLVGVPDSTSIPEARWGTQDTSCGTDFGTFSCTRGQPCNFSLAGRESGDREHGDYTSVFVSGRFTGCGACSGSDPQGDIAEDGTVDLGYALRDQEGGLRSICRCAGTDKGGPVAQLLLRGPRRSNVTLCTRGQNCTLKVEGDGLERSDWVVLMSNCTTGNPQSGFVASGTAEENLYLLHDPATWYAAVPTRYQVCWRAPCTSAADGPTCPAPEDTYIHVGEMELSGSYTRDYTRVLGENLEVPNIGFEVSDSDQMRLRRACGKANEEGDGELAAHSSGRVFDFGGLTEDRVQAGSYHLCWCQERDDIKCNAEWHFTADAGTVQIWCPSGQQLVDSRRCKSCPAGKVQPKPGLVPCTTCPIGQFSPGGEERCEKCQEGAIASPAGRSACVACWAWQSAQEGVRCSVNPVMLALLALFHLCTGVFCAMLVHSIRRRWLVVDVSLVQDQTLVTTSRSHGLANFGRQSFPVTLHSTGNPGLDSPPEKLRARVKDAVRLELITQSGKSIDKRRLDTSMGTIAVTFPYDLLHQRWLVVPMAVGLPVLVAVVVALGSLVLGAHMALEGLLGAAAAALLCAAAVAALRRWPRATLLERRLSEFQLKLAEHENSGRQCAKGPQRALAVGKLHELLDFFQDFIRDRTAYFLDTNILQPLTKPQRISYAELAGAEQVEWFVSHYWGTPFVHFCTALQKHAETVCGQREWTALPYWVCFCSNNQHYIQEELGAGWQESSFYISLKSGHCHGTCMVLDDKALPLTRIWCIFELLQTVKLGRTQAGFQGLVLCTSSGVLNTGGGSAEVAVALAEKVANMNLQTAQASNERDAKMIRDQVMEEMGTFDALNRFICQEMHNMLVRAQQNANQHFVHVLVELQQAIDRQNMV